MHATLKNLLLMGSCAALGALAMSRIQPTPSVGHEGGAVDVLQTQVAALERRLSDAEARRAMLDVPRPAGAAALEGTVAVPGGAEDAAGPSQPPAKIDEEAPQPFDDEPSARMVTLGERLAAQHIDSGWARGTEDALRGAAAELAPQSELVEARCGSTLCRIELKHADPMSHNRWVLGGVRSGLFGHGAATEVFASDDGHLHGVVFMAREGHEDALAVN